MEAGALGAAVPQSRGRLSRPRQVTRRFERCFGDLLLAIRRYWAASMARRGRPASEPSQDLDFSRRPQYVDRLLPVDEGRPATPLF